MSTLPVTAYVGKTCYSLNSSKTPFLQYASDFLALTLLLLHYTFPPPLSTLQDLGVFLKDTASQISIIWLWTTSSNNQKLVLRMKITQLS